MKRLLLGATSLLAIAASASAARAIPFDFTYTGSLVTFTVPTTDTYQILAFGAQGGNGTGFNPNAVGAGGLGAEIGGNFSLTWERSYKSRSEAQAAIGLASAVVVAAAGLSWSARIARPW